MSNGELSSDQSGLADVRLSRHILTAMVANESSAVADAAGDVRAAQERLREVVREAQGQVISAEGVVAERQQAVINRLAGMQLAHRTMEITAGRSIDTDDSGERNLAGVSGEVVDFEVGAVSGVPIQPADAIVLHIAVGDEQIVPAGQYALRADQADYSLSKLPEPQQ